MYIIHYYTIDDYRWIYRDTIFCSHPSESDIDSSAFPTVQVINVGSGHLISLLAHFMQPPNWTAARHGIFVKVWNGRFPISTSNIRYDKMIYRRSSTFFLRDD